MTVFNREEYFKKPGNGLMAELAFYGKMSVQDLEFVIESIKKYKLNKTTLTKDGHVRLWNLSEETLKGLLSDAFEAGVVCQGAYIRPKIKVFTGGLSGVEAGEAFDVTPYADAARAAVLNRVPGEGFSGHGIFRIYFAGSDSELADAADCNLVFVAQEDQTFQVLVMDDTGEQFVLAAKTEAGRFLSYVEVAVKLYKSGLKKADYPQAFWASMAELSDAQRQNVEIPIKEITKTGSGNFTCGPRIIKQKQEELYAVVCHHFGGVVPIAFWKKLGKSIEKYEEVTIRFDRELNLYVCNLLAEEVHLPLDACAEAALTRAERSGVSDRCALCGAGMHDTQTYVSVLLKEMRKLRFYDGVLPTFTISGCYRCCHTVPVEDLVFVTQAEYSQERTEPLRFQVRLNLDGGRVLGLMPQANIVEYLMGIGALVQSADTDFASWYRKNPSVMEKLTELYCREKTEEEVNE